jgi:hypothetical protein
LCPSPLATEVGQKFDSFSSSSSGNETDTFISHFLYQLIHIVLLLRKMHVCFPIMVSITWMINWDSLGSDTSLGSNVTQSMWIRQLNRPVHILHPNRAEMSHWVVIYDRAKPSCVGLV